MTMVAAIARDIRGLSEAAEAAAAAADWDAVERFEGIRLSLLNALGGLAADPLLRVQAVDALKQAQACEASLDAAIDKARNAQDAAAGRAIHSSRAGQAYANVDAA